MEISQSPFNHPKLNGGTQTGFSNRADSSAAGLHFLSGSALADRLWYAKSMLEDVPDDAVSSFAGVGNPFTLGSIEPGEIVLDIGCGAGLDALIAARMVGPLGRVIGVDAAPSRVAQARQNAQAMWATNVQFTTGRAEDLPIPNDAIDLVISNGVIHRCSNKPLVFAEIRRILKPGGRFQISDVLVKKPLPASNTDRRALGPCGVGDAMRPATYEEMVQEAGFRDVELVSFFNTFKGAPAETDVKKYGARGFNIRGYK